MNTDHNTPIQTLKEANRHFITQRGWLSENPQNIAMALSVEASELLEIFQFLTPEQSAALKDQPETFTHLREEIADVFLYLIRLCDHFDIDLTQAVNEKELKTAKKYPVTHP